MKQEAIALYRGNVQRTGEYQAMGVPDLHGIAWQFQTGGSVDLTPVVADGIVLLMSRKDRTLYALDALTGERRWHRPISYFGDIPPHVADDVVYVSDDGSPLALDLPTGQRLWTWSAHDLPSGEQLRELHVDKLHVDEEFEGEGDNEEIKRMRFGSPICYRDKLYVFSDSVVMALDLATRRPIWWQSMLARVSVSSLAIANDQIYLTAAHSHSDDVLCGLDSTTGLLISPPSPLVTSPSPQDDEILNPRAFAFRDGILYAITEYHLWSSATIFDEDPELERADGLAVGQDMVYVTTDPNRGKPAVIAFNRESGQMIWQRSELTAASSRIRFPTLAGSVLYLILDGQICCALDAATGRERWCMHLEKGILAPPPCIAGEMVFVAAGRSVYALH
jgi:eukaryotic-like serine/threonine-protein kinase